MDSTSWMAPPGAAQPAGIQSTAGAVPIWNEKGELSMKKVKVQRYVSGKRPDYAPASSEDEETDDEDFTHPRGPMQPSSPPSKTLTEAELQDPRLQRLRAAKETNTSSSVEPEQPIEMEPEQDTDRVIYQAEVVEMDGEDAEGIQGVPLPPGPRAESSSDSEADMDEEELALRRMRMRNRAVQRSQQEEEVLGKEDEGSEDWSSSEESSEYSEESGSEEEGVRLKPVFVRRKDRVTIHHKEAQHGKQKQLESEARRRGDERRRETLRMIEQQNRAENASNGANAALNPTGVVGVGSGGGEATEAALAAINTDDEADDAEYEAWKLRELRRLKRDKEERETLEREKEEAERLRNMTEDERRIELRNNPKMITNKAMKGKYKFLQKYYHRGAFFLDDEREVFKRDFSGATLDDHFDKTILPKVMQVKNFGRSGRTKYTHLVDQDTTSFESPWASDSQINHKFSSSTAGGMKQMFDRPSAHGAQKAAVAAAGAAQQHYYGHNQPMPSTSQGQRK